MAAEYIVKSGLSIVWGPCGESEALDVARGLNTDYQTDEYRIEQWRHAGVAA